nr:uncharacterized protein CTRU02_00258 [Colletotrichum truncatum]KAF6801509.1 hypothetical protein CTRU02_00258 [Colletotrichum truncatum]
MDKGVLSGCTMWLNGIVQAEQGPHRDRENSTTDQQQAVARYQGTPFPTVRPRISEVVLWSVLTTWIISTLRVISYMLDAEKYERRGKKKKKTATGSPGTTRLETQIQTAEDRRCDERRCPCCSRRVGRLDGLQIGAR